jgi:hypothetical protein
MKRTALAFVCLTGVAFADATPPAPNAKPRPPWECGPVAEARVQPPPTKDQLDRADIVTGLQLVKSGIACCFQRYQEPGVAKVEVEIARTGRAIQARVVRDPEAASSLGQPTVDCIEGAVRALAVFMPFKGKPMKVRYPFVIR